MSDENSSPEWLPAGWTTTVKATRNGKTYECYSDPSHSFIFHSKPEVLRYLSSLQVNHSPKSQVKKDDSVKPKIQEKSKDTVDHSEENYVVEKTIAEGLPPGWIKEVRTRVPKNGHGIRKDAFYTDPVSGYVFLSLKDSQRYLKTGVLGRNAHKPKDKCDINMEQEDEKSSSPAVAQGQKSPVCETRELVTRNQCSKLVEVVKDEEILSSTITEDHICLPKQDSDQCSNVVAGSNIVAENSSNPPETNNLGQRKERDEFNTSVLPPILGDSPEKSSIDVVDSHVNGSIQRRRSKSNAKKTPELPRRASKRLAGIELDPVPQLKTNTRTRRLVAKQSDEAKNSSCEILSNASTPGEHPGKIELETMANEQQGLSTVSPLAILPISKEQAGEDKTMPVSEEQTAVEEPLPTPKEPTGQEKHIQNNEKQAGVEEPLHISEEQNIVEEPANKADVESEQPLNLSLTDLWTDPCIDFAIKTLTGAIPLEYETNTYENNLASSPDLVFRDLWTDPCIEFAVKTLTGAIPVEEDMSIHNLFQNQVNSSDTQGFGDVMPPNIDSFCQTDYLSQHFDDVQKPQNKQEAPVASNLSQTSNRSFQNLGGSGGVKLTREEVPGNANN